MKECFLINYSVEQTLAKSSNATNLAFSLAWQYHFQKSCFNISLLASLINCILAWQHNLLLLFNIVLCTSELA